MHDFADWNTWRDEAWNKWVALARGHARTADRQNPQFFADSQSIVGACPPLAYYQLTGLLPDVEAVRRGEFNLRAFVDRLYERWADEWRAFEPNWPVLGSSGDDGLRLILDAPHPPRGMIVCSNVDYNFERGFPRPRHVQPTTDGVKIYVPCLADCQEGSRHGYQVSENVLAVQIPCLPEVRVTFFVRAESRWQPASPDDSEVYFHVRLWCALRKLQASLNAFEKDLAKRKARERRPG